MTLDSTRQRKKAKKADKTKMRHADGKSVEYRQFRLKCYRNLTFKRLLIGGSVVLLIIVICLIIGLTVNSKSDPQSSDTQPIRAGSKGALVQTGGGWVRGVVEDDALVFKGIPYAKPPIGKLRWKPPQPCKKDECWKGTFNATEFGPECYQKPYGAKKSVGKEDCLVLNVWTLNDTTVNRPVLFFVHGGELTAGSGNIAGEHPTAELLKELDIVGVSINYRLNAFGFLALDALVDETTKTSGNYGFMDQIEALKWVQSNIHKFGGDPNKVIFMGHSSGGTSAFALLTSPRARGLFHGVISMSGSAVLRKTSAAAAKDNEVFVNRTKCRRATKEEVRDCLYSRSASEIVKAIPWYVPPYWGMADLTSLPSPDHFNGALATVDGHIVPYPPDIAMATRSDVIDVPIIIGSTAQEIDYHPGKDFSNRPYADLIKHVRKHLGWFMESSKVDKVLEMYKFNAFKDNMLMYSTIVTDIRVTCPNHGLALNASVGFKSGVYRYVVTNWPQKPVKLQIAGARASPYAFHVWDLMAFFGFPEDLGYVPSERDIQFMKDLRDEFKQFIHKGKPKTTTWRGFPATTAEFSDDGLKVAKAYYKEQCDFWLDNGFFPYGWVN